MQDYEVTKPTLFLYVQMYIYLLRDYLYHVPYPNLKPIILINDIILTLIISIHDKSPVLLMAEGIHSRIKNWYVHPKIKNDKVQHHTEKNNSSFSLSLGEKKKSRNSISMPRKIVSF